MAGDTQHTIDEGLKKKPPREATADQLAIMRSKPELDHGSLVMMAAYSELSTERPGGMSMQAIPVSKIREWCRDHRLDYDASNHLKTVIRIVDSMMIRKSRTRK